MKKLSAQKQKPDIHFEIFLAGYAVAPKSWVGEKDDTAYCIAIILKNNSKRDFKFGHYGCSWSGLFQPTNSAIRIVGYRCSKNIPTSTCLKPGASCINYSFFYIKSSKLTSMQLSFIYYEAESYMKYWWDPNKFGETAERNSHPKPAFEYKSNIIELYALKKIGYFDHQGFFGAGHDPYSRLLRIKKSHPWDGFYYNYFN